MKRQLTILSCVIALLGMTGCELSTEAKEAIKQTGIILVKDFVFSEAEGNVTIPQPPSLDMAYSVTATQISTALLLDADLKGTQSAIAYPDASYAIPTHESMIRLVEWAVGFRDNILARGDTGSVYQQDSFDCDNFAEAFTFAAQIAGSTSRLKAQPLVGRIWVNQVEAWGGVPAGGRHALNWWVDTAGLWVFEPQGKTYVMAAELIPNTVFGHRLKPTGLYPNYKHIYKVFVD